MQLPSESDSRGGHRAAALRGLGDSMKQRPHQVSDVAAADRRSVLPPSVSRRLKRAGGRASPRPAHVRVMGVPLDDRDHADIRRKLGLRLGKFAWSIERVTVRARDANGPRGGVDQECTVKVVLSGPPASSSDGGTQRCRSPLTTRCTPLSRPSGGACAGAA